MAKEIVIIIILVNIGITFNTVTCPPPREVFKGSGGAQVADLKSEESNGGLIVNENKF